MRALPSLIAGAIFSLSASSLADPIVGGTMQVGETLASDAYGPRVGSGIHALQPVVDGWLVGAEISGAFEGYFGGWGCGTGTHDSGDAVPSVAVACFQPSLGAHLLGGIQASPSRSSLLRIEAGLGGTAVFLIPAEGGQSQREIVASALLRVAYLRRAAEALGATWWVGLALEERAVADSSRTIRSAGLLLEARR